MTDTRKRRPWMAMFAAIITLVLMYLPSYALYLRSVGDTWQSVEVPFYSPVEWLIDNSQAKAPLLW